MLHRTLSRFFCCAPAGSCCSKARPIALVALVGGLTYTAYGIYASHSKAAGIVTRMANRDDDEVHLYSLPRLGNGVNVSSPCNKLETYLRLAKIPYTIHYSTPPGDSPTGRYPYVEIGSTERVADSEFAIHALQRHFGKDEALSEEQRARKTAVRRITEDSLRWNGYRMLYVDNLDYVTEILSPMFPSFIPHWGVRLIMDKFFRKKNINTLNSTGMGDLSDEQYRSELMADVTALETLLKPTPSTPGPFVLGASPTSADATMYAWLAFLSYKDPVKMKPGTSAAVSFARDSAVIQKYIALVEREAFPDRDAVIGKVTAVGTEESFTEVL